MSDAAPYRDSLEDVINDNNNLELLMAINMEEQM
jgi:hypothetical protein